MNDCKGVVSVGCLGRRRKDMAKELVYYGGDVSPHELHNLDYTCVWDSSISPGVASFSRC